MSDDSSDNVVDLAARRTTTHEELEEKLRELKELILVNVGPAIQRTLEDQGALLQASQTAYVELESRIAELERHLHTREQDSTDP